MYHTYRPIYTTLILFLLTNCLNAQVFDPFFGDQGKVTVESFKNLDVHEGNIYIQKKKTLEKSTAFGNRVELSLKKYTKEGKLVEDFGTKGEILITGYRKAKDHTLDFVFKDDFFIASICEQEKCKFEVYNTGGTKVFEIVNPKFKLKQIIGVLDGQRILYGQGDIIYVSSSTDNQKIVYGSTPSNIGFGLTTHYSASSIKDNKIYQFSTSYDDSKSEFRLSLYDLNGKYLSNKVLYTRLKSNKKSTPIFVGDFENLSIMIRDKASFSNIPIDVINQITSPTKIEEYNHSGGINNGDYLMKTKSGVHICVENKLTNKYDKWQEPYRVNNYYLRAFDTPNQMNMKFGNEGIHLISSQNVHFFYRLSDNELLVCHFDRDKYGNTINYYLRKMKVE